MSLLVKRGDFQITTGTAGTVINVRGVGFPPKVVLFWWNGRDSTIDASGEASRRSGFGVAVSPTERCCHLSSSLHASANGEADYVSSEAACIGTILPGTTGAIEGLADLDTFVSDGFDIIIDDAFATAFTVHYLALGGTELVGYKLGSFTSPNTASLAVTGVSFKPDCVIILPELRSSVNGNGPQAIGIAAGPNAADQFVCSGWDRDASATSDTRGYARTGDCGVTFAGAALGERHSLSSFDDDGFTLSYPTLPNNNPSHYLALKGGRYRVKTFLTSVTTGAEISVTGVGFPPKAVLFFSHNAPESAVDTPTNHQALSIGVATGPSSQSAIHFQAKNGSASSDIFTAIDVDQVYINASVVTAQAVEGLMALTTFEADGFKCTMTDGDDAANFVGCLCIGELNPGIGEDEGGLIYRGAPVRYVDSDNIEDTTAVLESAQAAYGDTVDLAVLRVVGSATQRVVVSSVPHWTTAAAGPYWTRI
jgi:hypothetical protein